MKLTTIQATALKGQTFTHALGAATIFTGRNDAGKTARRDAVLLTLLGYLPELGKTNTATFALCNGTKMSVGADIEGHGPVRREWKSSGKSVKATEAGTDGLPETPLVLLDAGDYFGKSDAARVQMLWQTLNVDPAEWTPDAILAKLKSAVGDRWATLPADVNTAVEKGETLQAWMERLGDELKAAASTAAAEVRRWEQTAQGITAASLQETPVDASKVEADIATVTRRLEELTREHARLSEIARAQSTGADRQATVKGRIADLTTRIGEEPLLPRTPDSLEEEAAELEQRRAALLAERSKLEQQATEARRALDRLEQLQERLAEAQREATALSDAQSILARMEGQLAELGEDSLEHVQDALNAANRARADAEARQRANDEAQARLEAEAKDMVTKPCCPICGTRGEKFHELVEKRFADERARLQGEAVQISRDYQEAGAALLKAQTAQNDAIKAQRTRQGLERQIGEARLSVHRAEAAADRVANVQGEITAMGNPQVPVLPATTELEQLAASIAHLRREANRIRLNENLATAQEELRAIAIEGDDDAEQRAAEMEDHIEAQRARLAELDTQRQAAANQAADKKRLAQAAEEKERATAEGATIADVRESLGIQKAALIKATFGPLLETANRFTAGILDTPLEYRDGEIGRYKKGSWVPVRCMGGTHQAVTYAGIQAALGSSAPAKIVVVDELGRFDRENKRKFVANVLAAIQAGVIEQFVGIDVDAAQYAGIEGLTLEPVG
jgi:hypothetical protein